MADVLILTRQHLKPEAKEGVRKYRNLLSLDGGGLRGLITVQVLIELEATIKRIILQEKNQLLQNPSLITDENSFEIDLGDWFDQLAGTSTGGLLALYFAARGGSKGKSFDGMRVGSAANASGIYKNEGNNIFGTSKFMKKYNAITSGGQYQHTAAGLEGVLKDIFGEETLGSLKTSAVVTTVDVDNARTGIFFYKNSKANWGKKAADGINSRDLAPHMWGFACPLRRSKGSKVLVQQEPAIATRDNGLKRTVGEMFLENMNLESPDEAVEDCNRNGYWLSPMEMKTGLDFRLWEVARTTSAAPCFLPPVLVSPVNNEAAAAALWPDNGIRFIDGGLANNDPTWMGLSMMLLSDSRIREEASIANTAILSIGTGVSTTCTAYQPGGKFSQVPLMNILTLLSPLIGLTMNMNGEDKENILAMLYYGLLRVPRGQYLRIQLKQTDFTGTGAAANSAGGDTTSTMGASTEEGQALALTDEQVKSLNSMDNPDPKVLNAYEEIGKKLAVNYKRHLEHFVRCYVFNLVDPYTVRMPPARR